MMKSIQDTMTAKAAQLYLNNKIARYGRLSGLKIDSQNKTMELTGRLNGEAEPLVVQIGRYAIHETGDKFFLQVAQCSCSRPWLQNLLEDFIRDRRMEVPAWAAGAL